MKRLYILPLAMVLVLAGCVPKKKKTGPGISEKKAKKETNFFKQTFHR